MAGSKSLNMSVFFVFCLIFMAKSSAEEGVAGTSNSSSSSSSTFIEQTCRDSALYDCFVNTTVCMATLTPFQNSTTYHQLLEVITEVARNHTWYAFFTFRNYYIRAIPEVGEEVQLCQAQLAKASLALCVFNMGVQERDYRSASDLDWIVKGMDKCDRSLGESCNWDLSYDQRYSLQQYAAILKALAHFAARS